MTQPNQPPPAGDRVAAVIQRFGGIRPMAGKLEIAVTTVQGWKQRGQIPPDHHRRILQVAAEHEIALAPEDLAPATPPEPSAVAHATIPDQPSPPPPATGRGAAALFGALAAVVVVAVAAGLVIVTAPRWTDRLAAYLAASYDSRIEALERTSVRRTADLESLVAGATATDQRLDDLASKVAAIDTRVSDLARRTEQAFAGLERRLAELGPERDVSGLESRLAALERSAAASAPPDRAALAVAVSQLRAVAAGPGGFGAELDVVRALIGDDPALTPHLEPLAARAASGVPTLAALEARFGAVAAAVARASGETAGEGWVASSVRRLRALVSWRRTGQRAEDAGGAEMRLARAEAALGRGELAGAVDALQGLDDAAAAAAAEWLADAEARLAADRAIAALTAAAIAALGGGG